MISFFLQNKFFTFLLFASAILSVYACFIEAPHHYPEGVVVTIASGESILDAGQALYEKGALHSPRAFAFFVTYFNNNGVIAGAYSLHASENVITLAYRFAKGDTGLDPIRVTIPEGLNSFEIGRLLKKSLEEFDEQSFDVIAKAEEGHLFPDTYFFLPGTPPQTVVDAMTAQYKSRVQPYEGEILASGKSVDEIITMASLLEKEARKPETMKIVSGILWERIQRGMPLQVDAVFGYILGKSGYAPNFDDLKINSAYNTYTNRGLPPSPIANPGINAIEAALRPTKTAYLYYLTGRDGRMYYAKTFDQHVANRSKLR